MDTCIMDGLKPKLLVFERKGKDLVQGKALWAWKYVKTIFREEMMYAQIELVNDFLVQGCKYHLLLGL